MKIDELGFDAFAWVKPKTEADLIALARECLAELRNASDHLEAAFAMCETSQKVGARFRQSLGVKPSLNGDPCKMHENAPRG